MSIVKKIQRRGRPLIAPLQDALGDLVAAPAERRLDALAARTPARDILIVGVQSPRRPGSLDRIFAAMASRRHRVRFDAKDIGGKGKLENANTLVERNDPARFDWVFMIDDDVELGARFTDRFVAAAEAFDFAICQPAHRARSHWTYPITRRHPGAVARETSFVEVGPVAAFRRDACAAFFPLPALRFGWGLDSVWSTKAAERGWRLGIVDAAPLRHTSPIGATYDVAAATQEARDYMVANAVVPDALVARTLRTWRAGDVKAGV